MGYASVRTLASFVGRREELALLEAAVASRGFVTVLGLGGVGKTRLVEQLVQSRAGVVWLGLAGVSEPDGIWPALHDAVGISPDRPDAFRRVLDSVELLVLDNLEHLVGEGLVAVLDRIVRAAPRTSLLATSRRRLGIASEQVITLQPLPPVDARQLFVDRVELCGAEVEDSVVDALVEQLEGLPLALELAAARADLLPLKDLLRRLQADRLDAVGAAPHGRHRSVRAVLQQSWEGLSSQQQDDLVVLTVFDGPAPIPAAEAILGLDALDRLAALLGHSMIHRCAPIQGQGRVGMLQVVRAFLDDVRPSPDPVRAVSALQHAEWYDPDASGWDWPEAAAWLVADQANLERALRRHPDRAARIRLARLLRYAVWQRSRTARAQLQALSAVLEPEQGRPAIPATVDLLRFRATLHRQLDDSAAAWHDARAAAALARSLPDPRLWLIALGVQVNLLSHEGRWEEAAQTLQQISAFAERTGQRLAALQADVYAATLRASDPARLEEAADDLLRCLQALGDEGVEHRAQVLARLARVWMDADDLAAREQVRHTLQEALELATEASMIDSLRARGAHLDLVLGVTDSPWLAALRQSDLPSADHGSYRPLVDGLLELAHGDLDRAIEHLERGCTSGLRSEWTNRTRAACHLALAVARVEASDLAGARSAYDDGERLAIALPLLNTPAAERVRHLVGRLAAGDDLDDPGPLAPGGVLGLVGVGLRQVIGRRERARRTWTVAADGSWFEPPEAPRVDLGRRGNQRRLLAHLVRAHADDAQRIVPVAELAAAGWPGQQLTPASANNRVYVAVAGLRKAGLSVLQRASGGYRLDPDVPVRCPAE